MARYRMIKPEFWEDDVIAELPPLTRLFYISLWNFSDDEGYLEYREKWLKAKCLPYDDSANIPRMIQELSSMGRIVIQNNIIFLVRFTKHQRIDKPQRSEFKERYFAEPKGKNEFIENDSKNDLRKVEDRSCTIKQNKTKQNKREDKEKQQQPPPHAHPHEGKASVSSLFSNKFMFCLKHKQEEKCLEQYLFNSKEFLELVVSGEAKSLAKALTNDKSVNIQNHWFSHGLSLLKAEIRGKKGKHLNYSAGVLSKLTDIWGLWIEMHKDSMSRLEKLRVLKPTQRNEDEIQLSEKVLKVFNGLSEDEKEEYSEKVKSGSLSALSRMEIEFKIQELIKQDLIK